MSQDHPQLLLITRERLKPNAEAVYGELEERMAVICARMRCPNAYLALASATTPREVWWFVTFTSEADRARVEQAWAGNPELLAALKDLSERKRDLTDPPASTLTFYRRDLSGAPSWKIGESPFVVIATRGPDRMAYGSVFESEDGALFSIMPASTRDEADSVAEGAGAEARVFEVRPSWSLPDERWIAANAALWSKR